MGDLFGEVGGVDGGGGITEVIAGGGFFGVIGGAKVVLDTERGEDGFRERGSGGVRKAGVGLVSCLSVKKVKGVTGATHRLVVVVVDLHGCWVYGFVVLYMSTQELAVEYLVLNPPRSKVSECFFCLTARCSGIVAHHGDPR